MPLASEVKVVIVNGYNLNSTDWQEVVFGKVGRLGRVPMALYIAIREKADYMLWNTGASKKAFYGWKNIPDGTVLSEAAWTYHWMVMNRSLLGEFFPEYFGPSTCGDIDNLLLNTNKHRFESSSTNTISSALEAADILDRLIGENSAHVISVSSRNHTRAGHHFQMVLQEGYKDRPRLLSKQLRVSHECSHTGYKDDGTFQNVQINECSGENRYG